MARIIHRARVAVLAALVGAMAVEPALSAECVSNERDSKISSKGFWDSDATAHTTLQNNSKNLQIKAEIDRGGNAKNQKTIGPGEKISHMANFGATGNDQFVEFTVLAEVDGKTLSCAYRISWTIDSLVWDLAVGQETPCGDPRVLCPTCEVSCSKSYHAGKNRWNTTFGISD